MHEYISALRLLHDDSSFQNVTFLFTCFCFHLLQVEVDLALSAHANARRWYEMKKKQESKQEKTITAHEKAFKAAEKKTRQQLAQVIL